MRIWVSQGENNIHGPYDLDQVKDMVAKGELFPDKDWAQLDENGEWFPLQDVPGLSRSSESPSTPTDFLMPQPKTNPWPISRIMLAGSVFGTVVLLVVILLFGPDSDETQKDTDTAVTNQKTKGGEDKNTGGEQVPGNKELAAFMAKAKDLEEKIDGAPIDEKALEALKPSIQELQQEAGQISGADGRAANARADELAGKLADKLGRLPIDVTLAVTIAPPEAQYPPGCMVLEGGFGAFDSSKKRKSGDEIELEAVPAKGWKFADWSHGENRQGNTLHYTLPRAKSLTITARFEKNIQSALTLKDFTPAGNNCIVFADGFDKPIEFASKNRGISFSGNPSAQFSWRAIGSKLSFEPGGISYKPEGSSRANMRFENDGPGFTLDLSRRTLDLGDLKPQAGGVFRVDFASGFDAAFSLVVFDLNSLRKNARIVQLEGMVVGLAPSKSSGLDKVCTLPTEGIHARDGKWISGSYDRVKLKQQFSAFHDLVIKQPGAMAIIEEKLPEQAKTDFAYLKGLTGNVKAQATLGAIRYFDKGRADSLLNGMAAIIGIHAKHNPNVAVLKDKARSFENRLGVLNGKGESYPRILAAIRNHLAKNGIRSPAFFTNPSSIKGMASSKFINAARAQIDGIQTTNIMPNKQEAFRDYPMKMDAAIKAWEKEYLNKMPKNTSRSISATGRAQAQRDNARAETTWQAGRAVAFKKKFGDIPFDLKARDRYYAAYVRESLAKYIEKYKNELKERLNVFDGFDWAYVPIGGPELWAKDTIFDMQKALEVLKASLNMAAVQNLDEETTAPATWIYEASGHPCLRLN